MKVHQQPAYLLRARPFAESSLMVDLFTREHGRLTVLAKGARRGKSRVRGVLLPFLPLLASWSGKGQLPTLTSVETRAAGPAGDGATVNGATVNSAAMNGGAMKGETLASGFYLNELLLLLLHRHDAHEALFEHYHDAVAQLAAAPSPRQVLHALRVFEKHFLRHIGFGAMFDRDADTGQAIDAQGQYRYLPERGPVRARASHEADAVAETDALPVSGRTLHALRDEDFPSDVELREAQRLTRALIERQLGGRQLRSRRVLREMSRYGGGGGGGNGGG